MLGILELKKLVKKRKRVARGGAKGGKSGRGSNGQLARPGGRSEIKPFFEGGQMPLSRRLPRRGFTPLNKDVFEIVQLADIEVLFEAGAVVDKTALVEKGLIKGRRGYKVKVLGGCDITKKFELCVDAVSSSVKNSLDKTGGVISFGVDKGRA